MKNTILTYIIILSSALMALGQPINSVKYDDMLVAADQAIDDGNFVKAIEWYRNAYRENKSTDVALSIAYSYYKIRDFVNAERYYTRVMKDDVDNIFIDDRYAYGRTLRSLGELGQAQENFELITEISTDEALKELARIELAGMSAIEGLAKNEEVVVNFSKGDINSGSAEFSPVQFDSETIYFASFKRNKEIVLDGSEKKYHAKIYRSTRKEGKYGKPEELDRVINRDGFHVGNVTFSNDKRRMYFSRQMLSFDDITSSTIYYSDMGDDDWGPAEPLQSVNGDWIAKHPAVGELLGTRVLFFVSDMEGGQGGDDIYYATINGGRVGAPVNLGENINTKYDDITPHYHDGKLYFSTEGRSGLGGLDIYHSTWDGSNWSDPENLGMSYNTPFDDWFLSYNKEGSSGFLISNRKDENKKKLKGSETCCYDIYNFNIRQLAIDLLVGVGDENEKPLKGATVELADQTVFDSPQSKTDEEDYRFGFPLDAERKYRIITSKLGYISDTTEVTTYGVVEDKSYRKKVILKKLPPEEPEAPPLATFRIDTVTINEAIRFDNIYYEFEKWDILPESEKDLTIILNLMNDYSDMVIELSSHTDSRGTTPYNQNLSQKRAESAREWLLDRGVAENRIVPKGYGESVILNRCTNGVRCPDEEHRFNRRTEFKILEGPQTIQIKREVKSSDHNGGSQSIKTSATSSIKSFSSKIRIDSFPIITFKTPTIELGEIRQGETRKLIYEFENTGNVPLIIDIATACKCTEIVWPMEPVLPGQKEEIVAIFDSSDMEGEYHKTIDIIANTDPIVVEAKFNVAVVVSEK